MQMDAVPGPLREQLGVDATEGLLQLFEVSHREWRADVMAACIDRFERRLVDEVAGVRVQIAQTEAVLRRDMAETGAANRVETAQMGAGIRQEIAASRVELLKWCFLFWIGQVVATASLMGVMLRTIR
jgi:hypothetical protein